MNPFQVQAGLLEQYEQFTGGGAASLATLTLCLTPTITVPFTHTKVDDSFLLSAGQSSQLMLEAGEFRSCLIPVEQWPLIKQGLQCSLKINDRAQPLLLQLWVGGLTGGGEVFRFMLASRNFKV